MPPIFIIPYVSEEPERKRTFTSEMEKAAILCLAEVRRRKPKILKGNPEEIDHIVKMHYPLWGIPWEDKTIITDGLGLSSATISHDQIPNVIEFTEDLKSSSVSFSLFQRVLKKHTQTFREFVSTKKEIMESVIGDISALKSISMLINQAITVKESLGDDEVLVPPKVLREEAQRKAEKLVYEWRRLQMEIVALQYALDTLKKEKEHHKEKLSTEIEQIWRNYEKRITEMKKLTENRTKQIIREKEQDIKSAVKLHEEKLNTVLKEEGKTQQTIEKLTHILKEKQRKRKHVKRKYPKRDISSLDDKIEFYQEKIRELSKRRSDLSKSKEKIRGDKEETIRMIEEKYLSMVAEEMEKIEILKESRNFEISEKREEVKELEENASAVEAQLKHLMERKNNSIKGVGETTLDLKVEETMLIGIPFYIVQYRTPRKTRIDVYPPVTAKSYNGIIKKIQKTMLAFNLEARIQLLLATRSKALNEMIFRNFKKTLEIDSALREEAYQIGKSRNLLELPSFEKEATKGMEELEAEGWINEQERNSILSIYARK